MMRTIDLESLVLKSGSHASFSKGACVMEAVAYVAGEPWSDHPQCACPVLGDFLRNWNDNLDDATRQRLKPYIPRLVGTNDGNSELRSWMCMDWLTRECGPAFMDLTPALRASAAALRALPEIVDKASLGRATKTIEAARKKSDAARAAARAAAWDAAWAAAWDALKSTVSRLQGSAFALLDRMLDLPKVPARDEAPAIAE